MGGLLGSVGIGSSPGAQGLGFSASGAPLQQPTTTAQANTAYGQAQQGIAGQQSFLTALQGQNGIANQSSVFNQLQGVANGTGPNPAQAQLAQATGANTANQAALMAGQRGAGANTGLIARQAAQQGGANQQAAAGQAATLQAQQSLGALGQLGGIAGQQVGQQAAATGAVTGATQSEQGTLLNAIQGQNQSNVAMQSNINNANAGLAVQGAQQQQSNVGGLLGGAGQALALAGGGAVTAPPKASNPMATMAQGFGAQTPQAQMQQNGTPGHAVGMALGAGIKALFGGNSSAPTQDTTPGAVAGAGNNYATTANNFGADPTPGSSANFGASQLKGPDMGAALTATPAAPTLMAKGGKVPAMVSPGEGYLTPKAVAEVSKGKAPLKVAEKIPGKAKVKGDSLKNDTVPKTLEEGGIVLPRSVMESKHPHWEAHKFVSAIMKKGLHSKK